MEYWNYLKNTETGDIYLRWRRQDPKFQPQAIYRKRKRLTKTNPFAVSYRPNEKRNKHYKNQC